MLSIAVEEKLTVPDFCFYFVELTVRSTTSCGLHEGQKLMNVVSNVCFDAKELRRHMERVEECKPSATDRTHDPFRGKCLREAKTEESGRGLRFGYCSLQKGKILNAVQKQLLSTASAPFF